MSDWTDNNPARDLSDWHINQKPLATLGMIAQRDDCQLSYPSLVAHRHDEDFPREVRGAGGPSNPRMYRPEEVIAWVDRYLAGNPNAKRMSEVGKGARRPGAGRKAKAVSSASPAPDFTDPEKALEHIIKAAEKEIVGLQKRIDVLDENVSRATAALNALRGTGTEPR